MLITKEIKDHFKNLFNKEPYFIEYIPQSGSNRKYFRIKYDNTSLIGVYNSDIRENEAFIYFTKHFNSKNLAVPEILKISNNKKIYFIEDLGINTLFNRVIEKRRTKTFSDDLVKIYKLVLDELIKFQVNGHEGLNYNKCYPKKEFDKQSIIWDLNYFKYYFLKLLNITFDEQMLDNEFDKIADYLQEANNNYFMYRDFQSRNIIIKNDKPYFIDYQGGRKGPLQYDLASLLYQAKANIPDDIRIDLLNYYVNNLSNKINIHKEKFTEQYYVFVFIRILQTLGAYGYRGLYERKSHFITSLPIALENIIELIKKKLLIVNTSYLNNLLTGSKSKLPEIPIADRNKLTIKINSFSFIKSGIPIDYSEHGGGFVFDCRSLPNPHRIPQLRPLTGKDIEIVKYLDDKPEMNEFIKHVTCIIENAILNYQSRQFTNLTVNFGCTGGQHRSVYCAEKLSAHLKQTFDIVVNLNHIELEKLDEQKIM